MTKEQSEIFYNLETSLYKKEVRNSKEKVSELITDDFIEFGKSGLIYNKQDIVEGLANETIDLQVTATDFKARELSPEVVLVTYAASMLDTDNVTMVSTNRSSIWILRDGKWQMTFHQGTRVK